ncbi:hypothetical protein QUF63_05085 [Anaerolineales bacterium HSG25]|nr:hypothetical protein [Anaerolineales bacterium HSG25]
MYRPIKKQTQIFSFILIGAIAFVACAIAFSISSTPQTVSAKEVIPLSMPIQINPLIPVLLEEDADLEVTQQTSALTVTSGSDVVYTITIKNVGVEPAKEVALVHNPPDELQNMEQNFAPFIEFRGEWLYSGQFEPNQSVVITLTGKLVSDKSCPARNTISVSTTSPESNVPNNDTATINISADEPCAGDVYLPAVYKNPTPTPTNTPTPTETPTPTLTPTETPIATATSSFNYYEDFAGNNSDWAEGTDTSGYCKSSHRDNTYRIEVDKGLSDGRTTCWRWPPDKAYTTYGEIEAAFYQNDAGDDASYGIYMNGKGGGEYYLLRVRPNDKNCSSGGDWELWRNEDGESAVRVKREECRDTIRRGYGSSVKNILRLEHSRGGTIKVYINGTLMTSYQDDDQLEDGDGTGIYVRTDESDDSDTRLDYFGARFD